MADYVNKSILCEAYIHMDIDLEDGLLDHFNETLKPFMEERSKHFLNEDIEIHIRVKEGSTIAYATVVGTLYMLKNYPSIREGAILLTNDLKRMVDGFVSESHYQSGTTYADSIRSESRIGIVGTIKSAIDMLDGVKSRSGNETAKRTLTRLEKAEKRIDRILYSIDNPDDRDYVKSEMLKIAQHCIPSVVKNKSGKTVDTDIALKYRQSRLNVLSMLKPDPE